MKTVKFYDEQSAKIEASRHAAQFAKARFSINKIKEENLPIYWDILYDALSSGNVQDMCAKRWAKENYLNWDNIEVRNEIRAKFGCLSDVHNRYKFPQKWVTRNEDGSFEVNRQAIDEHFRERYTYTLTQEQVDAIEAICKGMDTLGIHTRMLSSYFARNTETGKTTPIGYRVHEVLNCKPTR